MGFGETVLLGAVAGFTIFAGLPIARIGRFDDRLRVSLAMFSVGILAFLFMDVTTQALRILEAALSSFKSHHSGFGRLMGLFVLLAVGFTLGTTGVSVGERALRRRRRALPPIAGGAASADFAPDELARHSARTDAPGRRALQTAMTIAGAIGLHNFAEGLAIGVSARAGAIGLATVLIVGFALHNATEGFGIIGPLGGMRPSWRWLGLAGLVGGGPTLLGALVGYQVSSDALELCFYALAGGALLYVIGEILTGMRRYGYHTLGLYVAALGFLAGVATDLFVTYGGG